MSKFLMQTSHSSSKIQTSR